MPNISDKLGSAIMVGLAGSILLLCMDVMNKKEKIEKLEANQIRIEKNYTAFTNNYFQTHPSTNLLYQLNSQNRTN